MEPLVVHDFPSLDGVPFSEKWERLKPTIERLYVQEKQKLPDIVKAFKAFGFDAVESQYKYQIKKWNLKKSTSTQKKEKICQVLQKRAQLGKASAMVRGGQDFDTTNLRRHLKTEGRRRITLQPGVGEADTGGRPFSGRITLSGNRIFMNWNMPYAAMRSSAARAVDHVSPLSDVVVTTPPSPRGAPSPTTVAVRQITAIQGARLFVQGRQMELLQSLDNHQRITLSTWMYQYWLFAYKTAKHWGRGPQDWTADILHFIGYRQGTTISISSPNTPTASITTPASQPTRGNHEAVDSTLRSTITMPSSLCRWSIHYRESIKYDPIPSPPHSPTEQFDLDDEGSWQPWPRSYNSKEYTEKLIDSLESNDFSSVQSADLPIAAAHVSRAARQSPKELLEEALGFSIMSRNLDLMLDLIRKVKNEGVDTSELYPFHLAVAYLDGSRTCCNILAGLLRNFPHSIRKLYINDQGHTVLDQLMIAILKGHTSCVPSVVDVVFKMEKRFEGEDVDPCGRWDADSDCVRQLLANGRSSLPFEWKHMFCHTSIQSICHCIGLIYWRELNNTPSGLFLRYCLHCGLKLQLRPLHTLVLVGVHLSRSGCENENLFGILACLLCLLSNGANPLLKADISVQDLFDNGQVDHCTHEELNPAELVKKASSTFELTWSKEINTGWQIIYNILRYSQAEWEADFHDGCSSSSEDEMSTNEYPSSCAHDHAYESFFGTNKTLVRLWAAVQTELLTYRRLEEGDEWISPNFNMHTLREGLIERGEVDIALLQNEMMKPRCDCGLFVDRGLPNSEDVCAYYFSNMEDWNRTTFLYLEDEC